MLSRAILSLVLPVLLVSPLRAAAAIVEIIDATGDGIGHPLTEPVDLAVGAGGELYVVGQGSQNAFRITPTHVITQIIDAAGDGVGHPLTIPAGIGVDSANNVYV